MNCINGIMEVVEKRKALLNFSKQGFVTNSIFNYIMELITK